MMGAGGLEGFWGCGVRGGLSKGKADIERVGDSGARTSSEPSRESLSAGRTVITGRRQRKPDWGKKAEMLKLLGCRPRHNRNQSILEYGTGLGEGSTSVLHHIQPRRRRARIEAALTPELDCTNCSSTKQTVMNAGPEFGSDYRCQLPPC